MLRCKQLVWRKLAVLKYVDLKAPLEPMEHVYFGELKKIRSLVAASASTGSADTQRHYRLLLYKIDQALK